MAQASLVPVTEPDPWTALDRAAAQSSFLEFAASPSAVPSVRLYTCGVLAEWGLGEDDLASDTESVVAELVANAVEAGRREQLGAPIRLTLLAGLRTVLIVVRDASTSPPVPGQPGDLDESGRGLLIVDALSARWDSKPAPGGGKVVRALVRGQRRVPGN
jgi:anti-sigma regulatory factor (Ser/Thr protein kinase)